MQRKTNERDNEGTTIECPVCGESAAVPAICLSCRGNRICGCGTCRDCGSADAQAGW